MPPKGDHQSIKYVWKNPEKLFYRRAGNLKDKKHRTPLWNTIQDSGRLYVIVETQQQRRWEYGNESNMTVGGMERYIVGRTAKV